MLVLTGISCDLSVNIFNDLDTRSTLVLFKGVMHAVDIAIYSYVKWVMMVNYCACGAVPND